MLLSEGVLIIVNEMRNSCSRSFVVRVCSLVLFLTGAIVFSKSAGAQAYLTQIGVPTFTTALPVEQGFLNAANGNLHLQIEFGSFPERGSRPFVAGLAYDSRIWNSSIGTWQPTNAGLQGGWRFFTTASPGTVSVLASQYLCDIRTHQYTLTQMATTFPPTATGTSSIQSVGHLSPLLRTVTASQIKPVTMSSIPRAPGRPSPSLRNQSR